MQNHTNSDTRVLVHHDQSWMFPVHKITIKVPIYTNYETNLCNFFIFVVCFQYFLRFPSVICIDKRDSGYKVL